MKTASFLAGIFVLLGSISVSAAGERETARQLLLKSGPAAEFRHNLNENLRESSEYAAPEVILPRQSVAKGVVFSALIPGAGQAYNGSYLKGALFLAIEVAALVGHFHYQNKGQDFEDDFERLADANWNEDAYWDWMSQISGVSRNDRAGLQEYESNNFSHFLPDEKSQQYYENIGKYNQFVVGWDDFREETLGSDTFTETHYRSGFYTGTRLEDISPTRTEYFVIRTDSNDNLKRATNLVTVAFLNHVASALDAGLSIKRRNQRAQAELKLGSFLHNSKVVPAMTLGVSW